MTSKKGVTARRLRFILKLRSGKQRIKARVTWRWNLSVSSVKCGSLDSALLRARLTHVEDPGYVMQIFFFFLFWMRPAHTTFPRRRPPPPPPLPGGFLLDLCSAMHCNGMGVGWGGRRIHPEGEGTTGGTGARCGTRGQHDLHTTELKKRRVSGTRAADVLPHPLHHSKQVTFICVCCRRTMHNKTREYASDWADWIVHAHVLI